MKNSFVKKLDIIIIAVVLCSTALCFLIVNNSRQGDKVVITVDNNIVAEYSLQDNVSYDVIIDDAVTNTVVINNQTVSVVNANCPDKICQRHKAISKTGESIICLPNKVVVTVESENMDVEIDGVAG